MFVFPYHFIVLRFGNNVFVESFDDRQSHVDWLSRYVMTQPILIFFDIWGEKRTTHLRHISQTALKLVQIISKVKLDRPLSILLKIIFHGIHRKIVFEDPFSLLVLAQIPYRN